MFYIGRQPLNDLVQVLGVKRGNYVRMPPYHQELFWGEGTDRTLKNFTGVISASSKASTMQVFVSALVIFLDYDEHVSQ